MQLINYQRFLFQGLIDAMESVNSPSFIYFGQIQGGDIQDGGIQDGGIQDGVPFLHRVRAAICLHSYIRPAAMVEGNTYHSRFTTRQPPRMRCPGGRWHPHGCEFATE